MSILIICALAVPIDIIEGAHTGLPDMHERCFLVTIRLATFLIEFLHLPTV